MTGFDDLKTRCAVRFQDPDNDVISDADWGEYVNDALRSVYSISPGLPVLDTRSTVDLTAGVQYVALPEDCFALHSVYDATNDYVLDPVSNRAAIDNDFPSTSTGAPEFYRTVGNLLYVYPTPDTAVTLRLEYPGGFAPLTGTDEPYFPEQFHHILVDGALALAYEDDGNASMADRHGSKFQAGRGELLAFLTTNRHGSHHEITDTFFG